MTPRSSQSFSATNPPTLGRVMRRPRWIAALVLALAVAAGFALLGQWQLGSAIQNEVLAEGESELPVLLTEITEPNAPVGDNAGGRVVTIDGHFEAADFSVVGDRVNEGVLGYWVVGHLVSNTSPTTNVVVAVGWSETRADAEAAARDLKSADAGTLAAQPLIGRYMPTESPVLPRPTEPADYVTSLAVAQQANLWESLTGPVFNGFIVSHTPLAGLEEIESVPPLPQETVNWLNLFYAIEWVVFAGFALYFWYRLAKDAWQKELEDLEELGQ